MKELSIEEKARRYDEAIELVNSKWHYKNQPCVMDVSKIFPELQESEDEKIRKQLLNWFKDCNWDAIDNGTLKRDDIITWLEKQDKQIADCPQNHKDINYPNACIVMIDFNGGEGFYKLNLEYLNKKQVEEIEEMVRVWNDTEKQGEQQPAWSEEDEDYYDAIITKLEVTQEDASLTDNQMDFLKSLKDRMIWKPTKEQLNALHDAAVYVDKSMFPYPKGILMKLYEQLKKLKGE